MSADVTQHITKSDVLLTAGGLVVTADNCHTSCHGNQHYYRAWPRSLWLHVVGSHEAAQRSMYISKTGAELGSDLMTLLERSHPSNRHSLTK